MRRSDIPPKGKVTKVKKKPLAPSLLEQEAKAFAERKANVVLPASYSDPPKELLAAPILGGLIATGSSSRGAELVREAYRYVDLLLKNKD